MVVGIVGSNAIHGYAPAIPQAGLACFILGFDGMVTPQLVDQYMSEGKMRNLSRLAHEGIYHPLATTLPPQSPVAWSNFITGETKLPSMA